MRKQVYISGKMIGSVVFEILGIGILIFGLISTKNYDNAAYVASPADLAGKQFVKVSITEYIAKPVSEVNHEYTDGVCQTYVGLFGTEYNTYNAMLDSGDYLRVQVRDVNKSIALDAYDRGVGDGVDLVAMVMDAKKIDYQWYNGLKNFDQNSLITDKTVREVGRDLYKNSIYVGVYLAAVALYGIISEVLLARSFRRREDD